MTCGFSNNKREQFAVYCQLRMMTRQGSYISLREYRLLIGLNLNDFLGINFC